MDKKVFKNYGLWVSVISFIGLMLGNYGLYGKIGLTGDTYKVVADSILSIFVLLGFVNNPSDGKGYLNNKKD